MSLKDPALTIPSTWTFETQEVAQGFDAHVREQLPWYDLVHGAILHLTRHYANPGSMVYDLGASTGNLTQLLVPMANERQLFIYAVEQSEEMAKKFKEQVKASRVGLICEKAEDVTYSPFSVAILNLTLQFLPKEKQHKLLHTLKEKMEPGGIIIVVDKFEPPAGYIATALYRLTLAGKLAGGATAENIVAKELSLSGIQRPLRHKEFEGWTPFFRFGDFAGYVWTN